MTDPTDRRPDERRYWLDDRRKALQSRMRRRRKLRPAIFR